MIKSPVPLTDEQLEIVASPVRLALLSGLMANGPSTVRALAARLGRQPASLYHHIARLEAGGLIEQSGVRLGPRRPQAVYALVGSGFSTAPDLDSSRGREALAKLGRTVSASAGRTLSKTIEARTTRTSGEQRNTAVRHIMTRLTPTALCEFNERLDELIDLAMRTSDAPDARSITLTVIVSPTPVG